MWAEHCIKKENKGEREENEKRIRNRSGGGKRRESWGIRKGGKEMRNMTNKKLKDDENKRKQRQKKTKKRKERDEEKKVRKDEGGRKR